MSGPGALRHRLSLEAPQRISDGAGGYSESWVEVAGVWAALEPSGGSETVESGRLAGRVSHTVTLRYRAGVTPAMRFRKGTRVFHILAVIGEDELRRRLRCLCEERDL